MLSLVFIFVFYLVLPSYLCFVYHHYRKKKLFYGKGSLWNYYRNEVNDSVKAKNDAINYRISNKKQQ